MASQTVQRWMGPNDRPMSNPGHAGLSIQNLIQLCHRPRVGYDGSLLRSAKALKDRFQQLEPLSTTLVFVNILQDGCRTSPLSQNYGALGHFDFGDNLCSADPEVADWRKIFRKTDTSHHATSYPLN